MTEVSNIQASEWDLEVVKIEGPVVVDFWHHMCGWCQKLNPIFAQLPEEIPGVKFLKVNILDSPENRKIAIDNGVMGTPTIKVFWMRISWESLFSAPMRPIIWIDLSVNELSTPFFSE